MNNKIKRLTSNDIQHKRKTNSVFAELYYIANCITEEGLTEAFPSKNKDLVFTYMTCKKSNKLLTAYRAPGKYYIQVCLPHYSHSNHRTGKAQYAAWFIEGINIKID